MPATPLTLQARAVVARLADYSSCQGNVVYLHKLIYEDSAVVTSLIEPLEAIDPPVDYAVVQDLYKAAAGIGSVGEIGGNTQTWPVIEQQASAAIMAAVDLIEAAPEEQPPEPR